MSSAVPGEYDCPYTWIRNYVTDVIGVGLQVKLHCSVGGLQKAHLDTLPCAF